MAKPSARWWTRAAEVMIILGCVVVLGLLVAPVFSSRPSESSVRNWEERYSSVLPPGSSDFRGHWQSHDIGVHIFSVRYPADQDCDTLLDGFVGRLGGYRVHQRIPGEIALRRSVPYAEPGGFDEFRFACAPSDGRIYGMFAHLDSEMESHPALVEHFHEIVSGKSE